jgi:hypothetical protein
MTATYYVVYYDCCQGYRGIGPYTPRTTSLAATCAMQTGIISHEDNQTVLSLPRTLHGMPLNEQELRHPLSCCSIVPLSMVSGGVQITPVWWSGPISSGQVRLRLPRYRTARGSGQRLLLYTSGISYHIQVTRVQKCKKRTSLDVASLWDGSSRNYITVKAGLK